jgi:hypothetical protein
VPETPKVSTNERRSVIPWGDARDLPESMRR